MQRLRRLRLPSAACLLALALLGPAAAFAGQFSIAKVRLEATAQRPADFLVLTNTGTEPVSVQPTVYSWGGPQESDGLVPTQEVAVSPALARLVPGASQVVRVYYKGEPSLRERAFRVLLREIPTPSESLGVRVTLTLSVPFFVGGTEAVDTKLEYRLRQSPPALLVKNDGNAHDQLTQLQVLAKDGENLLESSTPGYVLPGTEREFALKRVPADGVRVEAVGARDGKRVLVEVELGAASR